MIRAVLFDLEGTLVDFQWNLAQGEKELRQLLEEWGFPFSLFSRDDYAGIWNRIVCTTPAELWPELKMRLSAVYDRWDEDALSRWSLRPGVRELLAFLRERSVAAGLVTNIGARAVAQVLKRFGLGGFFTLVVTRNDVTYMKPRGEGLQKCLDGLGTGKAETLFVGDSVTDIRAGREVGIGVAIVRGGESRVEDLRSAGPAHLLCSLGDVKALVKDQTE